MYDKKEIIVAQICEKLNAAEGAKKNDKINIPNISMFLGILLGAVSVLAIELIVLLPDKIKTETSSSINDPRRGFDFYKSTSNLNIMPVDHSHELLDYIHDPYDHIHVVKPKPTPYEKINKKI